MDHQATTPVSVDADHRRPVGAGHGSQRGARAGVGVGIKGQRIFSGERRSGREYSVDRELAMDCRGVLPGGVTRVQTGEEDLVDVEIRSSPSRLVAPVVGCRAELLLVLLAGIGAIPL